MIESNYSPKELMTIFSICANIITLLNELSEISTSIKVSITEEGINSIIAIETKCIDEILNLESEYIEYHNLLTEKKEERYKNLLTNGSLMELTSYNIIKKIRRLKPVDFNVKLQNEKYLISIVFPKKELNRTTPNTS